MISSSSHNPRHNAGGRFHNFNLAGFLSLLGVSSSYNAHTIFIEVLGGLSMYLSWIYIMGPAGVQGWQAGVCPTCMEQGVFANITSSKGFTLEQYRAIPATTALAAGICSMFMAFMGNMPIAVSPGVTTIAFGTLAQQVTLPGAQAAVLIVGLTVLIFALASRQTHFLTYVPEDYRLGVAAGKGGSIILVALRNMGLVSATTTSFNTYFDYNVVLSVFGVAIVALLHSRDLGHISYIVSFATLTLVSLAIRAAQNNDSILTLPGGMMPNIGALAGTPDFSVWTSQNAGYEVFSFWIGQSIEIIVDMVVTVTALILVAVISDLGYNKETFVNILGDSSKMVWIFASVGLCNVIVMPFLGLGPSTTFIQSMIAVALGARTGLAAFVFAVLCLLTAVVAVPVVAIVPACACASIAFVGCLPVVQGLKHVDYRKLAWWSPALMAFFLITLTSSVVDGTAYSFMTLCLIWVFGSHWDSFSPQMFGTLAMFVVYPVQETNLVTTTAGLGVVLGGAVILTVIASVVMPATGKFKTFSSSKNSSHTSKNKIVQDQRHKGFNVAQDDCRVVARVASIH